MIIKTYTVVNMCRGFARSDCAYKNGSWPATTQLPGLKSLCQSLCQRPPIGPVLPIFTVANCLYVNNLAFWRYHGMEEVTGSIPVRSTNYFNHLAHPPFRDFVASLSQIPKPHHAWASSPPVPRS